MQILLTVVCADQRRLIGGIGLIGNKYVSVAFLKRQKNQTSSFTPIVRSDRSILCGKTKVPLTKLRNMYCEYGELFPIPFDK